MGLIESFERHATTLAEFADQAYQAANDDDDDDTVEHHDLALEAIDDVASFNLGDDIERAWVALRRIEDAWTDRRTRHALFTRYGIRHEQHYRQVQATIHRFIAGVRFDNALHLPDVYQQLCDEYGIRVVTEVDRLRQTARAYAPRIDQRLRFGHEAAQISRMQMTAIAKART